VRASATIRTPEAEGLALRMRKHFARKASVEVEGAVSHVRLPAGQLKLEPVGDALAVRASSEDEAGLARVRAVVASHLARFARADGLALEWEGAGGRAEAWVAQQRNGRHPGGGLGPGDCVLRDQAPAERACGQANEGRTHGNAA
jgi:uncharacterized protein